MEGSFFPRGFWKKLCPAAAPGLKNAPARGGWSPFPRPPRPGFLTPLPHASGWLGLPGLHALGPQLSLPGLWDTVARGTGAGVWRAQPARGVGDGGAPRGEKQGAEALVGLSRSRGSWSVSGPGSRSVLGRAGGRAEQGEPAAELSCRRAFPAPPPPPCRHCRCRVSLLLRAPAPRAASRLGAGAPSPGRRRGARGREPRRGSRAGGRGGRREEREGRGGGSGARGGREQRARAREREPSEGESQTRAGTHGPWTSIGKSERSQGQREKVFRIFSSSCAKEATRVSSSELPLDGSSALTPVGGFLSSSRFILSPTLAASFQPCALQ